ncbi:hypothetical protein ACFQ49_06595 [Kroppenstedtia eburnea]|uniref:hypothetical protein n=1 Tax=Kroppenstedtia eburnea TaxID=714067 RepID=UPI00362A20F1
MHGGSAVWGLLDHVADFPTGLLQQVLGFFHGYAGHLHQDGDTGVYVASILRGLAM